jgi:ABC-2 type transport system ATP-binding protein
MISAPPNETTLSVDGLTKRYPVPRGQDVLAVDGIGFEVKRGEVYGFLGPNGAGKTTTIRMLTGLARPTAGRAQVLGLDLDRELPRIKKRIGVVPEASNLYAELSAQDNLLFCMRLYGVPRSERTPRARALLAQFRLSDKRDTPFAKLSRGMKRSLTVAAALAHQPELVFLDEPTTGLDVASARGLRATIAELRGQGVTVFLTTHYLEEAERLCDRIALIARGRIVTVDTVEGLRARVASTTAVELTVAGDAGAPETCRVAGADVESALRSALAQGQGRRVLSVNTVRPTLEDAFIQLTGLGGRESTQGRFRPSTVGSAKTQR